jgi:hypothetical protein
MMSNRNNHALGFSPHHFPALSECIHHIYRDIKDSSYLERGNGFHQTTAAVLREWSEGREPNPPTDRKDIIAPVLFALGVVSRYLTQSWSILAVELELPILDADGIEITHGTVDLILKRGPELLAVDWKTGDSRDYSLQLDGYCLAIADRWTGATSVGSEIVFVDLEETQATSASYGEFSSRILDLYERWRDKSHYPHKINHYCDTCLLRGECPAWRREADFAVAAIHDIEREDNPKLLTARIEQLKSDPVRLEQFVSCYERLKTLVENDWKLKEALHTHLQKGYRGSLYRLATVHSRYVETESVDAEKWLLAASEPLGMTLAASAILVDAQKAKAVWADHSSDSFPVTIQTITQTIPGYSYVKRKGPRGKGRAAKLRKQKQRLLG